jgi:hypothetical protein
MGSGSRGTVRLADLEDEPLPGNCSRSRFTKTPQKWAGKGRISGAILRVPNSSSGASRTSHGARTGHLGAIWKGSWRDVKNAMGAASREARRLEPSLHVRLGGSRQRRPPAHRKRPWPTFKILLFRRQKKAGGASPCASSPSRPEWVWRLLIPTHLSRRHVGLAAPVLLPGVPRPASALRHIRR